MFNLCFIHCRNSFTEKIKKFFLNNFQDVNLFEIIKINEINTFFTKLKIDIVLIDYDFLNANTFIFIDNLCLKKQFENSGFFLFVENTSIEIEQFNKSKHKYLKYVFFKNFNEIELKLNVLSFFNYKKKCSMHVPEEAEENLRDFARFSEQNTNPILRCTNSGKIIYANKASEFLLSCFDTQIKGFLPESLIKLIKKIAVNQKTETIKYDCETKIYNLNFTPVPDKNYLNIYGQEITELIDLQKKIKNIQLQINQSDKMASIGTLASGIAHEINNPMGYIKSNAEIMKDYVTKLKLFFSECNNEESISEKFRTLYKKYNIEFLLDDLSKIHDENQVGIERVIDIVKTLKNFSRIDDNKHIKEENINNIIDSTLKILNNELKYDITVVKNYSDVPLVQCSGLEISQVIMNIVINAVHAVRKIEKAGVIKIDTIFEESKSDVIIKISDNGKGIPKRIQSKIFEPFFTTKEPGQGTGLGLSISYDIIKKHNGIINLYSDEIKGTCFEIVLPVKKSNEKYKVLIVDDSKTIRKLISLNLETTNRFTVYEAADAFEAELLFNELIPQVILLDIMMPGVDGMELCRKLRAEFFDRKIAIICITSSAIPDEKLMSAGFDSILRKPFGLDQLQNEIEKFL